MPRLLVVHPEPELRQALCEALRDRGHEVLETASVDEAAGWGRVLGIALVVADMELYSADGGRAKGRLRAILSDAVPFLFLRPGAGTGSGELLRITRQEFQLPFASPDAVAPSVDALLGSGRHEEGAFGDGSFDSLLERIEAQEGSGLLVAYREEVVKKVMFAHGRVVFCGSNDPRELVGQAFLASGLISEADLAEAMALQVADGRPLARILEALERISATDAEETLRRKFRESLLDLYLWEDGVYIYDSQAEAPDLPVGSSVPLQEARAEGGRRVRRWKELRKLVPSGAVRLDVRHDRIPSGFPSNRGDRRLMELLDAGHPVDRVCLELRGQAYAVYSRIAELVEKGILAPIQEGITDDAPSDLPAPSLSMLLEAAEEAMVFSELELARESFLAMLRLDPSNAVARIGLAEIDREVAAGAASRGLTRSSRVVLSVPPEDAPPAEIGTEGAFLLSRIDQEPVSVDELIHVCPFPMAKVLTLVERLVGQGFLQLIPPA